MCRTDERPRRARGGATRRRPRLIVKTVLLWNDEPAPYLAAAEAAGLTRDFEFVTAPFPAEPDDATLARADAMLAWRPPKAMATRAPRLRWVQSLTGGMDQWLASPDVPPTVALTCARGTHRVQMPENILGALFLITKQFAPIVLDQRERRWTRRINPTLAGTTLGILGLGAIGAEVARKAAAFDIRVIGTKRDGTKVPGVEHVYGPDGTETVLRESDFVLLLLPSTSDTRDLMNRARLGTMKRSAWLLNFGRGDLVVDDDLVAAVKAKEIGGAVLDVFRKEPLPPEHPFWMTDGIVVLPHVGGLHPTRDRFVAELFVENLKRFAAGQPLREVVDRARGY